MSDIENPVGEGSKEYYSKGDEKTQVGDVPPEAVSIREGSDILSLQDIDPALNAKMHIVNNVRIPEAPLLQSGPQITR
jgi:hypothetical protein